MKPLFGEPRVGDNLRGPGDVVLPGESFGTAVKSLASSLSLTMYRAGTKAAYLCMHAHTQVRLIRNGPGTRAVIYGYMHARMHMGNP